MSIASVEIQRWWRFQMWKRNNPPSHNSLVYSQLYYLNLHPTRDEVKETPTETMSTKLKEWRISMTPFSRQEAIYNQEIKNPREGYTVVHVSPDISYPVTTDFYTMVKSRYKDLYEQACKFSQRRKTFKFIVPVRMNGAPVVSHHALQMILNFAFQYKTHPGIDPREEPSLTHHRYVHLKRYYEHPKGQNLDIHTYLSIKEQLRSKNLFSTLHHFRLAPGLESSDRTRRLIQDMWKQTLKEYKIQIRPSVKKIQSIWRMYVSKKLRYELALEKGRECHDAYEDYMATVIQTAWRRRWVKKQSQNEIHTRLGNYDYVKVWVRNRLQLSGVKESMSDWYIAGLFNRMNSIKTFKGTNCELESFLWVCLLKDFNRVFLNFGEFPDYDEDRVTAIRRIQKAWRNRSRMKKRIRSLTRNIRRYSLHDKYYIHGWILNHLKLESWALNSVVLMDIKTLFRRTMEKLTSDTDIRIEDQFEFINSKYVSKRDTADPTPLISVLQCFTDMYFFM